MNQPHNNPQLDQFISSKLKNLDIEFEQQVWLEMEDSLSAQGKGTSMPKFNSKYIMASTGIVVIGISLFFLIRSFSNQSIKDEEKILVNADSMQVLQEDSSKIISKPVVSLVADSAVKDTAKQSMASADTVAKLSVFPETTVVQNSSDKLLSEEKSAVVKETPKTDLPAGQAGKKKTKTSSLAPTLSDTGFVPEIILPPDTSKKDSEWKSETILPSSDSSKTTNSTPKKSGKNGEQKPSVTEQPKTDSTPVETKPDSLR